MKTFTRVLNAVFTIAVLLVLAMAVVPYIKLPNRIRIYAVASQSMVPALLKGDLIAVRQESNYQTGDIITFSNPSGGKRVDTITHRIIEVGEKSGAAVYKTKGDANNAADGWNLTSDKILGKYVMKVPLVGSIITFSRTPLGLVLLIILPGTMIAYSELLNIAKEIRRLFHKKKPTHETKT